MLPLEIVKGIGRSILVGVAGLVGTVLVIVPLRVPGILASQLLSTSEAISQALRDALPLAGAVGLVVLASRGWRERPHLLATLALVPLGVLLFAAGILLPRFLDEPAFQRARLPLESDRFYGFQDGLFSVRFSGNQILEELILISPGGDNPVTVVDDVFYDARRDLLVPTGQNMTIAVDEVAGTGQSPPDRTAPLIVLTATLSGLGSALLGSAPGEGLDLLLAIAWISLVAVVPLWAGAAPSRAAALVTAAGAVLAGIAALALAPAAAVNTLLPGRAIAIGVPLALAGIGVITAALRRA